jgi:hypothetical protein
MSTQIAENLNIPNDQWITASVWGKGNITGNRSQTLIANSSWSQVNGGVPFGTSFGSLVTVRNYRGGTSEIWNGYGGFASTYCGTESQSWNDPSIASYEARNLTGTRFTPHDPPGVPAPQLFSKTSKTFVMPPSLVEDAEAAVVEEGEESAIGRFLWSLVPGSSLVGAYRDYQKGSYVSAALNGLFGLADLATVGSLVKVRSGLKLLVGFMKVRVKDAVADEAANQAGVAVAERLGPEAGFVTQIIVSATLSKNVSQQNKTQLGFADDGARRSSLLSVDSLAADARRMDSGGELTKAGRALSKHANRPGSQFSLPMRGSPADINKAAHGIVDEILTNPRTLAVLRNTGRFGKTLEFWSPDGRGLRYYMNGSFIGFLEPPL